MPISDDELIAYLLGDATPQQRQRVEAGVAEDAELRSRLGELRMVLGQLDALQSSYEPPADLVESTMACIDQASLESETRPVGPVSLAGDLSLAAEARPARGTWDSLAMVLCLSMLLCMFLPTVLRARSESRKAQCAYQLGNLGRGLLDFASMDPQRRFPAVAVDGPQAFTGVFAVHLSDLGYVKSPSQLCCPSLEGCVPIRGQLFSIPTLAELDSMDASQLKLCHNEAGGDFAYSLGVLEDGAIVGPRCEGRAYFPILSDSPVLETNGDDLLAHEGRGLNLFFEDGHVEFLRAECLENGIRDNPFCNLRQAHEVGLNTQDASLGPSHFGPLGND